MSLKSVYQESFLTQLIGLLKMKADLYTYIKINL